jgi:hypothetical protein
MFCKTSSFIHYIDFIYAPTASRALDRICQCTQIDHEYYKHFIKNDILPSLFSALFINLKFRSNEHWELDDAGNLLFECRALAQEKTTEFLLKYENYIRRADGPSSRFHLARTNVAKLQGASFLWCGFRYEPPPRAIPIILHQYNHQIELLMCDLSRSGKPAYTTTGTRFTGFRLLPQYWGRILGSFFHGGVSPSKIGPLAPY